MSKTTFEIPIPIGNPVYLVSKTGFVFKNTVTRYIISGNNPHDNRICMAYIDGSGNIGKRFAAMNLIGRTIFGTEQEAIRAARAIGRRTVNENAESVSEGDILVAD